MGSHGHRVLWVVGRLTLRLTPNRPGRNRTCNPRFWSALLATPALKGLLIFKDLPFERATPASLDNAGVGTNPGTDEGRLGASSARQPLGGIQAIDVIRIVKGRCAAIEPGIIEVPPRRRELPDELRKVVPVFVIAGAAAFRGEIELIRALEPTAPEAARIAGGCCGFYSLSSSALSSPSASVSPGRDAVSRSAA